MVDATLVKNFLTRHLNKEKEEREEKERTFKENDFFRIRETDNFLMVAVRKVGWVVRAIFAFITWLFLWFVTTFSG